jgi:hypothetical protein
MSQHTVTTEFLNKTVGLAEATNAMMKAAADQRTALVKAATVAVSALEKAGYAKGQDNEKLVSGIAEKPELAVELVQKLAEDIAALKATKQAGAAQEEEHASVGSAAESEDHQKRAAELSAAAGKGQGASANVNSNAIWDKGFGFSR